MSGQLNDDYHIALVPRENGATLSVAADGSHQFLFLPVTWRQLVHGLEQDIRHSQSAASKTLEFGDVRINFATMQVRRSERTIVLTRQQFKLLKFLTLAPEQVFSRDELLNQVWGYRHYPTTRTVDNHILVLRQKLESVPSRPVHFLTVRGIGYRFTP